jgi:CheY-like chemotaxis protein
MMTVETPSHPDHPSPIETARLEMPAPRRPAPLPTGMRVLVVGPDFETIERLQVALGDMGHDVRLACTAADAVWIAWEWRPAVVICRLGHPELDGYAVGAEVRKLFAGRPPVMIALSEYRSAGDREWAVLSGFAHHLGWPPDAGALGRLLPAGRVCGL